MSYPRELRDLKADLEDWKRQAVKYERTLQTVLEDAYKREDGPGYGIPGVTIEEVRAALSTPEEEKG